MDAFATIEQLQQSTGRTFTEEQSEHIEQLLADASTYLREDVIGMRIYPREQVTFTTTPDSSGELVLPQQPVVSVDAVTRNGQSIEHNYRDGSVFVDGHEPVTVTFTFGYAEPPANLTRWTIVLVAQALVTLELNLGLTAGGLSSVQIDDFRAAFADGGAHTGMQLSPRNEQRIRDQYRPHVQIGLVR